MELFREFLIGRNTPGEIVSGRYPNELPNKKIAEMDQKASSAFCAPLNCLQDVHKLVKKREDYETKETILKSNCDWKRKDYADGIVLSLYEQSSHGNTKQFIGDPVADSLAVVTRSNSCIMALADGVSWGNKSRLASTCSIYASVTYLDEHLPLCKRTRDVFRHILKAFEKAHQCIVSQQGTMTTLCVGVVVPLLEKSRYGFCVVNVGDSYAYVFNKHYGVKEVTEASHPIDDARDMRQCGGALGPADGCNPDISNLTCAFVTVEKDDLVFLCSDGISDNFDPLVAKFTPKLDRQTVTSSNDSDDQENSKNIERGTSDFHDQTLPEIITNPAVQRLVCSLCDWEESRRKKNSPDTLVDEKNKRNSPELSSPDPDPIRRGSNIIGYFPILENFPSKAQRKSLTGSKDSTENTEDEERALRARRVCSKCGKYIKRDSEWSILNKDEKSSVLDYITFQTYGKMSTSKSLEKSFPLEKQSKDLAVVCNQLKSNSFTSLNEGSSAGAQLEKEDSFTNYSLQNATSRGRFSCQPSFDESTGQKFKTNMKLTPRERREGALERLNEIISKKLELDDGGDMNVGEICAQLVNFVIANTEKKRKILERVPQSELNRMSSKDRKTHNEEIKKELEGVPGKLDHASIVCYEVGCHIDGGELSPVNKASFERAKSIDPNLLRSKDVTADRMMLATNIL